MSAVVLRCRDCGHEHSLDAAMCIACGGDELGFWCPPHGTGWLSSAQCEMCAVGHAPPPPASTAAPRRGAEKVEFAGPIVAPPPPPPTFWDRARPGLGRAAAGTARAGRRIGRWVTILLLFWAVGYGVFWIGQRVGPDHVSLPRPVHRAAVSLGLDLGTPPEIRSAFAAHPSANPQAELRSAATLVDRHRWHPDAYIVLARVHRDLGDIGGALTVLTIARDRGLRSPGLDREQGVLLLLAGRQASARRESEAAERLYHAGLDRLRGSLDTTEGVGYAICGLSWMGKMDDARRMRQRVGAGPWDQCLRVGR